MPLPAERNMTRADFNWNTNEYSLKAALKKRKYGLENNHLCMRLTKYVHEFINKREFHLYFVIVHCVVRSVLVVVKNSKMTGCTKQCGPVEGSYTQFNSLQYLLQTHKCPLQDLFSFTRK